MDDLNSKLSQYRKVFLYGEIEKDNSSIIVAHLFELDNANPTDPIEFYINSVGGEVEGLFAIYDAMHLIKAPVKTICIGEASSAAAIILAAGDPGHRYATPNSQIMIHQVQVGALEGSGTDLQNEAKATKKIKKKLTEILARHTQNTYRKVYRDCEIDKFMSAEEALKYGIIDHIYPYHKKIPDLKVDKKTDPIDLDIE